MADYAANLTTLHTERLTLRPINAHDVDALRSIRSTAAVSKWWGELEKEWPLDDENCSKYVIDLQGRTVGLIQWTEESEPMYRHAGIDLFLADEVQGDGLGREAICVIRDYLINEHGHHRITIDPAANNTRAIRCYEKCGFERVGVMRAYEKNRNGQGWHDGLLMEYVVDA